MKNEISAFGFGFEFKNASGCINWKLYSKNENGKNTSSMLIENIKN